MEQALAHYPVRILGKVFKNRLFAGPGGGHPDPSVNLENARTES
jgi:hypothetical protein